VTNRFLSEQAYNHATIRCPQCKHTKPSLFKTWGVLDEICIPCRTKEKMLGDDVLTYPQVLMHGFKKVGWRK